MTLLSQTFPPEKLQKSDTSIVIVGCGDPLLIDLYVEDTASLWPIYADPTSSLFDSLGMIKTQNTGAPKKYAPESQFAFFTRAIKDAFTLGLLRGLPAHKAGNPAQVGGEFLFERHEQQELKVTWCYRMQAHKDHTEIDDLAQAIGVE